MMFSIFVSCIFLMLICIMDGLYLYNNHIFETLYLTLCLLSFFSFSPLFPPAQKLNCQHHKLIHIYYKCQYFAFYLRNMFDETRRQTSMVYLSCLVINLIFVFIPLPSNKLRLLLLIITMMIQFCASCWYTLSYIPYGRKAAIRIMKKVIGIEDNNTSSDTTTNPYIGLQLGIQLPTFGGTMA